MISFLAAHPLQQYRIPLVVLFLLCLHVSFPADAAAADPASFPLQITDTLGRQVIIKAPPQRVISLSPSNTERLFAVGAGATVVGVTSYDTYPPAVQTRQRVGGFAANTISVETIVSLQPDVVLAAGEIQRAVIEALVRLGIVVVALEDPQDFDGVYATILLTGRLTGRLAGAQQVIADIAAHVRRVQQTVATLPQAARQRVFYEVFNEPLMTAGPGTFVGQMLEMAGGVNIFADMAGRYGQVSAEEVVRRNPACILGLTSHRVALTSTHIKKRPGWSHVTAVQDDCVHLLDDDLVSRPGPRVAEGLESIARTLYPTLFSPGAP